MIATNFIENHYSPNGKEKYIVTPDLTMADTYTIPKWHTSPGRCKAVLTIDQPTLLVGTPNTRSRIAQSGILPESWQQYSDNTYGAMLLNYSPRDIILENGFGYGPLFETPRQVMGDELVETVRYGIDVDLRHIIFTDLNGTFVSPTDLSTENVSSLKAFGIRVNTAKLWEVDPSCDEPLVINGKVPTREAVGEFLVSARNEHTSTPFAVTTTMPVDIHGFNATILTNLYGSLKHCPSIIHIPHPKYNWKGTNGHNCEGIRLEFIKNGNLSRTGGISRAEVEANAPFIFLSAHPQE